MNENSEEKKHKPSQKKLEQLRKDGQFLRAREFYSACTLSATLLTLIALKDLFYQIVSDHFTMIFSHLDAFTKNADQLPKAMFFVLFKSGVILLPVFFLIFFIFFLSVKLLGGLSVSSKNIHFSFEKLSFIKNIKKIFSTQNALEIFKSFLKIILFFSILFFFIKSHIQDLDDIAHLQHPNHLHHAYELIRNFLIVLLIGILIIGFTDAFIAYYFYHKKAMMTQQELKDENKETEGNPEVKRKLRQKQRILAMARLAQDIPQSTVIITNPTHYAIALKYAEGQDAAPKIIAKGVNHMAQYIKSLAIKHAIPIYEAPELARAIYYSGKEGQLIHPDLYMAVALVLSYILQLKEYQMGRSKAPVRADDLKIPPHLVPKKNK